MVKSKLALLAHASEAPDWWTVLTLRLPLPERYRCQTDPGQALQVFEDKYGRAILVKPAGQEPGVLVGISVLAVGEVFAAQHMTFVAEWVKRAFGLAADVVFMPTDEVCAMQFCVKTDSPIAKRFV